MAVQPTPAQLILFQEIYDVLRKDGSWPIHLYLDTQLDQKHGLVLDEVLATVPEGLLRVYQPVRDDREIMLRVAGMLYCAGADGDVALFVRALRWCVAKRAAFRPKSATEAEQLNVATAEVAQDWAQGGLNVTEEDFDRLRRMFEAEWIGVSVNGMPGKWSWTIPKDMRRFRPVGNVYDYLRLIADDKPEPIRANQLVEPGPVVVVQPAQQVRVVGGGRDVRDTPTLTIALLHPGIRDACEKLFANEHYRQGVFDATLALRDLVREKSGLGDSDDSTLMGKALGGEHPKIVVADLSTETGRNIQRGTAYLAQGVLARLRNVLAHEKVELDSIEALEMVGLVSRVARDIDR
jgi:uncharacterized protein (TIGR02391 family)